MSPKKYILYADDDVDDRDMMETQMAAYSEFSFLAFSDGSYLIDHLDRIEPQHICLIILDINMPLLDGIRTLQHIRTERMLTDLPIVMFTTSSSPMDSSSAEKYHANVITKPVTYTQLQDVTRRMIEFCASPVK